MGHPAQTPDLDAYFERVAYGESPAPTLDTLHELHALHPQAIPFENLNPFLGWPVPLDCAALQRKLVRDGRGGYCFEHNLLFGHVLRAIGFKVTGLGARVIWNAPPGTVSARTHMLLRVDLNDGPWVADVGFAGLTLTAPLLLQTGIEQTTPQEKFRLVEADGSYVMQARLNGEWRPLYSFDLQPHLQSDYEVTNWYLSNHPASKFVTGLIAARVDVDRRYALRDNEFAIHTLDGKSERRLVQSGAELCSMLERTFRIRLGSEAGLRAALDRVAAGLPKTAP